MSIEHKTFDVEVKDSNPEDLTVVHFISTEKKDRGGDIMRADGMKIGGRPVVLFAHGRGPIGTEPIAKPVWIKKGTNAKGTPGILAKTQFFPDDLGRRLWQKAVDGYMPNWSIGYRILKAQDIDNHTARDVLQWELLEYSPVGVPMNPDAQGPAPNVKPGKDTDPDGDLGPILFKMFPEDALEKYGKALTALPAEDVKALTGDLGAFDEEVKHIRIVLGPSRANFCEEEQPGSVEGSTAEDGKAAEEQKTGEIEAPTAREGIDKGEGESAQNSPGPGAPVPDSGAQPGQDEEKPYPNEHACRLEDPEKFDRIRRQNDKFGTGIHAIWGVKDDKTSLQSIRLDSEKFTAAEAQKWLKDHEYTCKPFEAASKKDREEQIEGLETDVQDLKDAIYGIVEKIDGLSQIFQDLPGSWKNGRDQPEIQNVNPPDQQRQAPRLVFKQAIEPPTPPLDGERQRAVLIRVAKDVLGQELATQIRKLKGKVD